MRRNIKDRKILNGVKVKYEITGLNQDRLIAELKKRDFTLFDVKKFSNRLMHISVNLRESENFFAITKNLCYNVRKLTLKGKGLPVYKLLRNFGLVLGVLAFLAIAFISNDYILDFSYSGSGSLYKKEVSAYLEERGITKLSRFSAFSIQTLEDEILADNKNLTFVSVTKKGNTLALYLTLKAEGVDLVSGKAEELRSSEDGVIESIKVYRGTALVSVGDSVSRGDLLVDGYVDIKEQRVHTGVLAYVALLRQESFTYMLDGLGKEELALSLAGEERPENEMIDGVVTVKEVSGRENRFLYTVRANFRCVIYAK